MAQELFRDPFAQMTLDAARRRLKLVWFEATAKMSDEDFKAALARLAEFGEAHRAAHVVVDVRAFRHQPGPDITEWRDTEIIPRYNQAGVEKFAFLLPNTAATRPPAAEGPAHFPTGWFNSETAMDAWLQSS